MQFLAARGYEYGENNGLCWIKGQVKRIAPEDTSYKIPHMGWNNTKILNKSDLFKNINDDPVFYFVHSYCFIPDKQSEQYVTSICDHGTTIAASLQKDNIFGVQFHPEKSQGTGLKLLNNFLEYVNKNAETQINSNPFVQERENCTEYRV
jgi:glutamine amidotransferase